MSSNIGGEAQRKYDEYLKANALEERIRLLTEFLSLVPKHKGTEKIVALNRSRLAKLKRELEERQDRRKQQVGGAKSAFSIRKAENAQVVLVSAYTGALGVGKSSILYHLTGAGDPETIGRFTPEPVIGVYRWEGLRFQFVDMPAIMRDAHKGVGNGTKIFPTLRNADLIALCVDLSQDVDYQFDLLLGEFEAADIHLNVDPPPVTIEKTGSGRVQVRRLTTDAKTCDTSDEDISELVRANGILNCVVKVSGPISLNDLAVALNPSISFRRAVVLATKGDLPDTKQAHERLLSLAGGRFRVIPTAIKKEHQFTRLYGFEDFGQVILDELGYIKIFTKSKRAGQADQPLILPRGSTIADVALKVHKNFYDYFKFAFVYRESSKHARVKVGLNFPVEDGDVVELFASV
ncbi:MAG: TGS domain-containing protein [Promethearchaeota archaeon]